ncbi:hypothetical protein DFQ28_007726 [Apophysomyces sp. BC1034]|nr:hypothetical protein DFQ30_004012 [Apophysomyces sp. BC1015]KAG0186480.1 hypothetical protein DFQ28_007726 [Apophysomyces sp. BC1034]
MSPRSLIAQEDNDLADARSTPSLREQSRHGKRKELYTTMGTSFPTHSRSRSQEHGPLKNEKSVVDYRSLNEALQEDEIISNSRTMSIDSLASESIELAVSEDEVGSETLMALLNEQKDLEQQMTEIEEQENATPTDRMNTPSSTQFEMPTQFRVLYMGAATEKDKRSFLTKLSEGLSEALGHDTNGSLFPSPLIFRERKHHLLLMSLVPGVDDHFTETYEDCGISIIEADFSWSTPVGEKSPKMIENYVWMQCESACDDSAIWVDPPTSDFEGFVYPDKTTQGIDLCVYFYNGGTPQHEILEQRRVEDDLVMLWRLKKLGVPILPILSSTSSYRRSSSPAAYSAANFTIPERRSRLADLLSDYKIRCIDIANLEVGQPSFQKSRGRHMAAVGMDFTIEQRLGREWASSSVAPAAPYQILTINQFVAMHRHSIYELLRTTRQRALNREKVRSMIRTQESKDALPSDVAIDRWWWSVGSYYHLILLLVTIFGLGLWFLQPPPHLATDHLRYRNPWSASLTMMTPNMSFILEVRDPQHQLRWTPSPPVVMVSNQSVTIIKDKEGYYRFGLQPPLCGLSSSFQVHVDIPEVEHVIGSPILFSSDYCQPRSSSSRSSCSLETTTTSIRSEPSNSHTSISSFSMNRLWGRWTEGVVAAYHSWAYLMEHRASLVFDQ